MGKKIVSLLLSGSFFALLQTVAGKLFAADQPFYEGKTIKIIVSSSAGGGTDAAGRLVARFLPKYLPGNPNTIVQNMPGGGGTIANNYFANEVKADGLTILQDSTSGAESFKRGGSQIKFDPRKNIYLGGVARGGTLLTIRKEARPRLMNRAAKPVVVGDTDGIRSWVAMTVWAAEYLGWNLRWIYGYPGSNELALAIRQGEIDMWSSSNARLVKDLNREGMVDLLCTDGNERRKDFPEVPTFVETLGAKQPSGLPWQAYYAWAGSPDFDKILAAPPGTPDPLVKILREAFMKLDNDPEVEKEGNKFFGEGWRFLTGEKVQNVVREHIEVPQAAKDFVAKMREKYGLPVGPKKT
jgi:tripartite-type tricarboxylate transporter receptor subunit TctC